MKLPRTAVLRVDLATLVSIIQHKVAHAVVRTLKQLQHLVHVTSSVFPGQGRSAQHDESSSEKAPLWSPHVSSVAWGRATRASAKAFNAN